jgi:hypothetical protein
MKKRHQLKKKNDDVDVVVWEKYIVERRREDSIDESEENE